MDEYPNYCHTPSKYMKLAAGHVRRLPGMLCLQFGLTSSILYELGARIEYVYTIYIYTEECPVLKRVRLILILPGNARVGRRVDQRVRSPQSTDSRRPATDRRLSPFRR